MIKALARRVFNALGYEIGPLPPRPMPLTREIVTPASDRIHYGSGPKFKPGWLNVDWLELEDPSYLRVNLIAPHPFPSDSFRFAFSEDLFPTVGRGNDPPSLNALGVNASVGYLF